MRRQVSVPTALHTAPSPTRARPQSSRALPAPATVGRNDSRLVGAVIRRVPRDGATGSRQWQACCLARMGWIGDADDAAEQNLYLIAGLKDLRHKLGYQQITYRALRRAARRTGPARGGTTSGIRATDRKQR